MIDRAQILAISFDLDDTLWPVWPAIMNAERDLIDWFAREHPEVTRRFDVAGMRAVRDQVAAEQPELHHDLSAIRMHSIARLLALAGADPAAAADGFEVFYAGRNRVDLYPDARAGLIRLGSRYRLFSLSNGNADLARMGLDHHFEASFSARTLGFAKPDRRGFLAVASAAGLTPAQVLHVGDHPEQDVAGARAAGLQAVWLNRDAAPWPLAGDAPPYFACLQALAAHLLDEG